MNNNQKINCIIIHGCPSDEEKAMDQKTRTYDKHWIPWLKQNLIAKGIETKTPLMPKPWHPVYDDFKKEFEKLDVNENTVLVGHSCGSAFLVRWLGESKKKIYKLILVAPWKIPERHGKVDEYRNKFYTYQIDETIRDRVEKIIMFTSNNEEEEGKQSLKIFHSALGGEIIELKNYGHFTMGDMGTESFSELINKIIEIEEGKR